MMIRIRLLIVLGLTAFGHVNPLQALTNSPSSPAALHVWEIYGALAAKNRQKAWSATMYWAQRGANAYQIRLIGPLSSGSVLIERQGRNITFQDKSKKISSPNAEALLLKQTGIRLPVNNLYYWVRGLPAPGPVQSKVLDKSKRLQQLIQHGYTIGFTQYALVHGLELPNKIQLKGNGLMVKVLIKRWKVDASFSKNS